VECVLLRVFVYQPARASLVFKFDVGMGGGADGRVEEGAGPALRRTHI
jgi:hypothetical protein